VVAALYRRYRPETFAELIGQSQVTDPLRAALRADRVGHAYLFSGPRGCGKTTSARILARCLNCVEGPTDTPCGVCPSCVELSRDGGGSLDVVEIDAASHNGVDDARDIRERAVFAPARDRYKIFILDEAHMVTPQGFNALLKIVEEPPEHVKFIFATTEPEKVIGTIRSRTHHYPFRLVPPAQLLDYVQELCTAEGIAVEPGVLPLVVRAGGGSVRDTLSLLDQLMAGSEDSVLSYSRAVGLLGYTPGELLDESIDALGRRDAPAMFAAIDRVIQTGQDPRRFVEDFLERLRDLVLVAASPQGAAALLRGVPQDQLDRMATQATVFGSSALSRAADLTNAALTELSGATSPRLHLELLAARLLVELGAATAPGTAPADAAPAAAPTAAAAAAPAATAATTAPVAVAAPAAPGVQDPAPTRATGPGPAATALAEPVAAEPAPSVVPPAPAALSAPMSVEQLRHAWPQVLSALESRRLAWLAVERAQIRAFDGEILSLSFATQGEVIAFREHSEALRTAILQVLGIRVKFTAKSLGGDTASVPVTTGVPAVPAAPVAAEPAMREPVESEVDVEGPVAERPAPAVDPVSRPAPPSAAPTGDWEVVAIPGSSPAPDSRPADSAPTEPAPDDSQAPEASAPEAQRAPEAARSTFTTGGPGPKYGEAVVRQVLGAKFIEEEVIAAPLSIPPIAAEPDPKVPSDLDDPGPDIPEGFDFAEGRY